MRKSSGVPASDTHTTRAVRIPETMGGDPTSTLLQNLRRQSGQVSRFQQVLPAHVVVGNRHDLQSDRHRALQPAGCQIDVAPLVIPLVSTRDVPSLTAQFLCGAKGIPSEPGTTIRATPASGVNAGRRFFVGRPGVVGVALTAAPGGGAKLPGRRRRIHETQQRKRPPSFGGLIGRRDSVHLVPP